MSQKVDIEKFIWSDARPYPKMSILNRDPFESAQVWLLLIAIVFFSIYYASQTVNLLDKENCNANNNNNMRLSFFSSF